MKNQSNNTKKVEVEPTFSKSKSGAQDTLKQDNETELQNNLSFILPEQLKKKESMGAHETKERNTPESSKNKLISQAQSATKITFLANQVEE